MKAENKQKEYFVSHLGQHMGPWTLEEIARRMSDLQLIATDFIYDEEAADWIELNKHEALLSVIAKAFRPKAAPVKSETAKVVPQQQVPTHSSVQASAHEAAQEQATAVHAPRHEKVERVASQIQTPSTHKAEVHSMRGEGSVNADWFIQKESHRFGPLTSFGVIRALQEKTIHDFEFIWKEGMGEWVRIAQHPEFSVEKIRDLATQPKAQNIFIKRQHPRATFMNEVMVHDHSSIWTAQSFQAGVGGAGLIIPNAALHPGHIINLHFAAHDGLGAFNVKAEIVSKKFVSGLRSKKTPVPYGVKFVEVNKKLQMMLQEYFSDKTQPGWMYAGK